MPNLRKVCSHCGSTNVTHDALVRWSEEDQRWEIASVLDNADCDECGDETHIEDEEIPVKTKYRVLMQEATYYEVEVECEPGELPADAAEEAFVHGHYRVTGSGERSVMFTEEMEESDG